MKICSKCKETLELQQFSCYTNTKGVTKYNSWCKPCMSANAISLRRKSGTKAKLPRKPKLSAEERAVAGKEKWNAWFSSFSATLPEQRKLNEKCRLAITEKRCTSCNTTLPISRFGYKRRSRKDGSILVSYNSICKSCKIAENKKYHNPVNKLAIGAKRRATKINATPKWLTKQQLHEMKLIYATRLNITRKTGITHHVDHIVPLNHPEVCGLHVPWNLRVITEEENVAKSNSLSGIPTEQRWYPLDQ